ncbi:MAG: polysaccharide pyruvyl transferase family protein [Bacteroidales bacterium]|nr:polysaccharide pyruvyl transferase family protein [Lachnoclostridium sp.]MCM1384113.1 polysaccharide pyruvyl transferase family protein [Lachnoclostridium sp.]MCM1465673.1 polysaccharide pyruvyl transferase family protein [Bacteroidales bacterium]
MAKAGILSMQRILNYGSFLQAYALKRILEQSGWEVEFVDYHPGECLVKSSEKRGMKRQIQKVMQILCYKASLKDKILFIQYKKSYAGQYFPLLGVEKNSRNYSPKLDLLVIGSDEVFNCVQNNANVGYSRELFGYGHNAAKAVSYAASFGNTTLDKIEQYGITDMLANDLKHLDGISVRDQNSQDIINVLIKKKPPIHPDPVLLYDWKRDIPDARPLNEKYLVVYGYSGRFSTDECKSIKDFAAKYQLKIVCIGGIQNIKDTFINCSPFEVLAYFANAEYVVTDTFHGTILSVVMHRRFAAFVRSQGYGNAEKLGGLLAMLGLEQRKVLLPEELEERLCNDIEYPQIDARLVEWQNAAMEYLKEVTTIS